MGVYRGWDIRGNPSLACMYEQPLALRNYPEIERQRLKPEHAETDGTLNWVDVNDDTLARLRKGYRERKRFSG